MQDIIVSRLDDGTVVSDYNDHATNRKLLDDGYEIQEILTCHDVDHTIIYWKLEIDAADIPF